MATWYPGALTYWQWSQANSFLNDFKNQSKQIKNSIHDQTNAITDQTKSIVASNDQISSALENGFYHLAEINELGFKKVTSAIEAMHSDFNYYLGILIQRVEYQNALLNNILHTLQTPFETQVREYYSKGCLLTQQGILEMAVDYFNRSLALPTGDIFFPSYYQLGRLYLSGKEDSVNLINPQKAAEYLLIANKFGTGIYRINEAFGPILADCKFFISQAFYFQLNGTSSSLNNDLINNAIRYGEEAVSLNSNLSQAYYHLAKYYSYTNNVEKMVFNFGKAFELDRNYSLKFDEDRVFENNRSHILNFLSGRKTLKKKSAEFKLQKATNYILQLEKKNISQSPQLFGEFQNLKRLVETAKSYFQIHTFFGYDDCEIKLDTL